MSMFLMTDIAIGAAIVATIVLLMRLRPVRAAVFALIGSIVGNFIADLISPYASDFIYELAWTAGRDPVFFHPGLWAGMIVGLVAAMMMGRRRRDS